MLDERICTVARIVADYKELHPDRGVRGLFETVGLDENDLGHLALHAGAFTEDLDLGSFAWGAVLALMLARERWGEPVMVGEPDAPDPTLLLNFEFSVLLAELNERAS